jgi:hypothetical protein
MDERSNLLKPKLSGSFQKPSFLLCIFFFAIFGSVLVQ